MSNFIVALVLGLWSGFAMVMALSGIGIRNALVMGVVAGLVVGDPGKGLEVGATCTLMLMGFYTYGGATIPDFVTGAIFGTVVAARTNDVNAGLAVAAALGLLMTQMDILGRATTTVFQHLGDAALAKNSIKTFEMWTLAGTLPWLLSRALPVFLGLLFIDNIVAFTDFATSIEKVQIGLTVVGRSLPAVGFALLLSFMNVKKFWPFMVIGFVLYAFTRQPMTIIGLALVGAALGALFIGDKGGAK